MSDEVEQGQAQESLVEQARRAARERAAHTGATPAPRPDDPSLSLVEQARRAAAARQARATSGNLDLSQPDPMPFTAEEPDEPVTPSRIRPPAAEPDAPVGASTPRLRARAGAVPRDANGLTPMAPIGTMFGPKHPAEPVQSLPKADTRMTRGTSPLLPVEPPAPQRLKRPTTPPGPAVAGSVEEALVKNLADLGHLAPEAMVPKSKLGKVAYAAGSMAAHPVDTGVGIATAPFHAAWTLGQFSGQTMDAITGRERGPTEDDPLRESPSPISRKDAAFAAAQLLTLGVSAKALPMLDAVFGKQMAAATVDALNAGKSPTKALLGGYARHVAAHTAAGAAIGASFAPDDPETGVILGAALAGVHAAKGTPRVRVPDSDRFVAEPNRQIRQRKVDPAATAVATEHPESADALDATVHTNTVDDALAAIRQGKPPTVDVAAAGAARPARPLPAGEGVERAAPTRPPAPRAYVPASSGLHVTPEQMLIRNITNGLRTAHPDAIDHAAPEMATRVPAGAVLVPLPDHTGSTAANEALAYAMAEHSDAAVANVLDRKEQVANSQELRDKGKPGVTADEHEASMMATGDVPKDRPVVFVDGLETTGAGAEGARRVLQRPDATLVTYAKARIPSGEQAAAAKQPAQKQEPATKADPSVASQSEATTPTRFETIDIGGKSVEDLTPPERTAARQRLVDKRQELERQERDARPAAELGTQNTKDGVETSRETVTAARIAVERDIERLKASRKPGAPKPEQRSTPSAPTDILPTAAQGATRETDRPADAERAEPATQPRAGAGSRDVGQRGGGRVPEPPARAEGTAAADVAGAVVAGPGEQPSAASTETAHEAVSHPELGKRAHVPGPIGTSGQVHFSDGTTVATRYRVIEASDLQPSHNAQSFAPNPVYPTGIQGREYAGGRGTAARQHVETQTGKLQPHTVLDAGGGLTDGPPLITPHGLAIAGNQRAMMIQRAVTAAPEKYNAYRTELEQRAASFGLKPEHVAAMTNPILVREIADPSIDTNDASVLSKLNQLSDQTSTKSKDALSAALGRAKHMVQATDALSHFTDTVGDETIREYLGSADGSAFVRKLFADGVFSPQERGALVDAHGAITDAGKDAIEAALRVAAIGDPDIIHRAPAAILRKLESAIPAIIQANATKAYSLMSDVQSALELLSRVDAMKADMVARGEKVSKFGVAEYLQQQDIFGNDVPADVVQFAAFLERTPKAQITPALREYARRAVAAAEASQSDDIFGEPPPTPTDLRRRLVNPSSTVGERGSSYNAKPLDNDALREAFADWNAGRAYLGDDGNYRLKGEAYTPEGVLKPAGDRTRSRIAPWNRAVKTRFPDNAEFHRAAQALQAKDAHSGRVGESAAHYAVRRVRDHMQDFVDGRAAKESVARASEEMRDAFDGAFKIWQRMHDDAPKTMAGDDMIRAFHGATLTAADAMNRVKHSPRFAYGGMETMPDITAANVQAIAMGDADWLALQVTRGLGRRGGLIQSARAYELASPSPARTGEEIARRRLDRMWSIVGRFQGTSPFWPEAQETFQKAEAQIQAEMRGADERGTLPESDRDLDRDVNRTMAPRSTRGLLGEPTARYNDQVGLFGDETPPEPQQEGLFGATEGTAAARDLASTERAARAELEILRQRAELEKNPEKAAKAAQRIALLTKLVDRNAAISSEELAMRARAESAPAPRLPGQSSLFERALAEPGGPAAREIAKENADIAFGGESQRDAAVSRHATAMAALEASKVPTVAKRLRQVRAHQTARSYVDFRGVNVATREHLARMMDLMRDPQVERMNVFVLKSDAANAGGFGAVAAHTVESAGAINFVDMARGDENGHPSRWIQGIIDRARRAGATKVVIGHNHPSGDATASQDDKGFTQLLDAELKKAGIELVGHVGIDHDEYFWIEPDGTSSDRVTFDPQRGDRRPAYEIGTHQLDRADDVARLVGDVTDPNTTHLVYVDAQHRVVAVEPRATLAIQTMPTWLPQQLRALGASRVIVIAPDKTAGALVRSMKPQTTGGFSKPTPSWSNDILDVLGADPHESGTGAVLSSYSNRGFINADTSLPRSDDVGRTIDGRRLGAAARRGSVRSESPVREDGSRSDAGDSSSLRRHVGEGPPGERRVIASAVYGDDATPLSVARARAQRDAYARFTSAPITVFSTGRPLTVTRPSIRKALGGRREQIASMSILDHLIEDATFVGRESNTEPAEAPEIPTYGYYETPLTIDGKPFVARMRVREYATGTHRYYGHEIDQVHVEPAASPELTAPVMETGGTPGTRTDATGSIPQDTRDRPEGSSGNVREDSPSYGKDLFGDPASSDQPITGVKNAVSAEERERLGMDERARPEPRTQQEMYDAGKAIAESDPTAIPTLLEELRTNPEKIVGTHTEAGLLLKHRVDLDNKLHALITAKADAQSMGDTAAEELARLQLAAHRETIKEFVELAERTGTATGRALAARKMMSKLDYSLSTMEAMSEAAKGSSLTQKELERVKALYDEIQEKLVAAEQDVAAAHERAAKAEAELHHANLRLEVAGPIADRITSRLDSAAEQAMARIRRRGMRAMAGMDPEDLADHAIIGAAQIARGVRQFAQWSEAMIEKMGQGVEPHLQEIFDASGARLDEEIDREAPKGPKAKKPRVTDTRAKMRIRVMRDQATLTDLRPYLRKLALEHIRGGLTSREAVLDALHADVKAIMPDATRADVRDALSGYGDFTPLDKSADKTRLREIQAESQKLAQLEALEKGRAPLASGFERPEPNDETRRLAQQVNAAKKAAGILTPQDDASRLKSALESAKTRTRNAIKDLQTEIDTGERIVRGKPMLIGDAELQALKLQLAELRKAEADVFKKPGLTDAQRLERAAAAAKRSADLWQDRLDKARKGVFGTAARTSRLGTNPELDALRAKTNAAREAFNELKALTEPPKEIHTLRSPKQPSVRGTDGIERSDDGPDLVGGAPEGPNAADDLSVTSSSEIKKGSADLHPAEVQRRKDDASNRGYRTRLAQLQAEILDRIARADYAARPVRPGMKFDRQSLQRKADLESVKQRFQDALRQYEKANRTRTEKVRDAGLAFIRAGVLSWPTVIGKLTSVALSRLVTTPITDASALLVANALPRLARGAPRYGTRSARVALRAEGAAQAAMWTDGLRDAGRMLLNRQSRLTLVHGKHKLPHEWFEYFGSLHGALKEPIKRAEYARALERLTVAAIERGENTTDEFVQLRLSTEAYLHADRAISMNDNAITDWWNAGLRKLEATDKATGKANALGVFFATVLRADMPVVKAPTNVILDASEFIAGLPIGGFRAAWSYAHGLEDLAPVERDSIIRMISKGLVGVALMALYFYKHDAIEFGGFYQPGQTRAADDVPPDALRVGKRVIKSTWIHNPLFMAGQFAATIARVAPTRLRKRDEDPQGYASALAAASVGLVDEIPVLGSLVKDYRDIADPRTRNDVAAKKVASLAVPGIVQWAAKQTDSDSTRRAPTGFAQHLEYNVPGLRQRVPTEDPRTQMRRLKAQRRARKPAN